MTFTPFAKMERKTKVHTFTLTGNKSKLSCNFNPPIYLNPYEDYEMALLNFESFNSIPNIDETNNKFHYEKDGVWKVFTIPVGTYDITDISRLFSSKFSLVSGGQIDKGVVVRIEGNNNTQRSLLKSNVRIDFSQNDSIGSLLGFHKKILEKNITHLSDEIVNIFKVNALQIECNLSSGAYTNGEPVHVLYHFFPNVPAGFKIIEAPQQPIYLPVTMKVISSVTVRVLDQNGNHVDFRGEEITVRLHLRQS